MPQPELVRARARVEAELRVKSALATVSSESEALDLLEIVEAASNMQVVLPSRQLDELLAESAHLAAAADAVLAASDSPFLAQCLWDRVERASETDGAYALASLLSAGSRSAYSAADGFTEPVGWKTAVRDRTRLIGSVVIATADDITSTLAGSDRSLRASEGALRAVVAEYVSEYGISDAIDVFVPVGWLESEHDSVELPPSFGEQDHLTRTRASRLPSASGVDYQAGTYEFGRFGAPCWYVRPHGTVRDVVAEAHEQGHTYAGMIAFDQGAAYTSLMPAAAGECIAYAAEMAFEASSHDPAIRQEVRRMAAQNAFCALFGRQLRIEIETGEPGHLERAWRETSLAAALRTRADDHEWLLVSPDGILDSVYEDHAVGYIAGRGGIESVGHAGLVAQVLDAFGESRLRSLLEEWLNVGEDSLGFEETPEREERFGILLPNDDEIAARIPLADEAAAIFLSGSLVAGLGHANSDVDVYVVLPGDAATRGADTQSDPMSGASVLAFYVGHVRWDVEYVASDDMDKLVDRLFGDPLEISLSYGDQDLAYRCLVGVPIKGEAWLAETQAAIRQSNLFDAVVEKHHSLADGLLDDALGLLEYSDVQSAAHCVRLAFEHMTDAWLAKTGRICPSSKWRDRQLTIEAAGPIAVEEYRSITQFRGFDGSPDWIYHVIDRARELGLEL